MKNAAVLTVTLMAATAFAQVDKEVVVAPVEGHKAVNVFVERTNTQPYKVNILSRTNETIWKEEYLESMAKSYILDALPQGEYKFVVKSDDSYFEQALTVEKSNVLVSGAANYAKSPTVMTQGLKVMVDLDVSEKAPVEVRIADSNGNRIYEGVHNAKGKRIAQYDLSQAGPGRYQLTFMVGEIRFDKYVTLSK